MKVYIVVCIDDLDGSEQIEEVFSTRELARKYINNQKEKYLYRIIDQIVIDEF